MRSALAYEWMRLHTIRSTYWLVGLTLGFQLVMTMLIAWQLPASGPLSGGEGPASQLITVGAASGIAPLFLAYIIGIVGVFSMGHEYKNGMIRATLTAVSGRRALFAAKLLLTGALASAVTIGCVAIGVVSATVFGVDLPAAAAVGKLALGMTVFVVLFTWSGLAFAALTRNQTAAVALLMLVPSVIESIIRAVVLAIKAGSGDPTGRGGLVTLLKFLPYDAGGKMYTRASLDDLLQFLGYRPFGAVAGGVVLAVFVAALLGLSGWLFVRRDA